MDKNTGRPTDHRNIDLNKLNLDVVFGQSKGMIIWQPRIGCWFVDREWANQPFPGQFEGMSHEQVYRNLGCSNRPYDYYSACFVSREPESVRRRDEWIDDLHLRQAVETPVGSMVAVSRRTPNSIALIHEKRWIETPEDMKVATWLLDNSDWSWDHDQYERALQICGDLAAPQMYMPRPNIQDLYIITMGVEHAVYAIYEWGSIVDDYFRALHENHLRMIDVINSSPIRIINFGDNLHCGTCSPRMYEEYVLPVYLERCDKLHMAGKFVSSHWDGDTKSLLKYARVSGLDGIEAITPKPQGDVTLDEVKAALGDDIYLLDGIPAILFNDTYAEDELAQYAEDVIRTFAPKLVLGISDEMSSTGDLERIRMVGRIVDDYNASVRQPSCVISKEREHEFK